MKINPLLNNLSFQARWMKALAKAKNANNTALTNATNTVKTVNNKISK